MWTISRPCGIVLKHNICITLKHWAFDIAIGDGLIIIASCMLAFACSWLWIRKIYLFFLFGMCSYFVVYNGFFE